MAERKLGRGLDSLLGDVKAAAGEEVIKLSLSQVRPGPFQPRRDFDDASLAELADSIKQSGVLQPVIVRPAEIGYEIVVGERRVRAARLAGISEIPGLVRSYRDDEVMVLSLVENVQRKDLNPIDRARAYRNLVSQLGVTQEDVAGKLGLNRSSVTNMIRLLDLPAEVQDLVRAGALSMGHARALLAFSDEVDRLHIAERIVKEGLSVRATENLSRDSQPITPKRRSSPRKTPQVAALEAELRGLLGTKVSIRDHRVRGKITIEYYSPTDFERILETVRGSEERGFGRPADAQ